MHLHCSASGGGLATVKPWGSTLSGDVLIPLRGRCKTGSWDGLGKRGKGTLHKQEKGFVHFAKFYDYGNLVWSKSSGPKCHAVAVTALIFVGFCVSHRSQLEWGGTVAIAAFPPPPCPHPPLPWFLFAVPISHGRGQIWPQICGQSSPQAVSERVK